MRHVIFYKKSKEKENQNKTIKQTKQTKAEVPKIQRHILCVYADNE